MSRRTERIASVIRGVVAGEMQRGLADPRYVHLSSITRVEVSSDMSLARIHVSVMDENEARRRLSIEALNSAAGRIRAVVRRQLTTRQVPLLEFRLDDSLRLGSQTVAAIEAARAEDARRAPDAPPEPTDATPMEDSER